MSRTCDELAELRSGLVDGALAPADRERVVAHLVGCASCRADVDELRAVRELLGRSSPPAWSAPTDLSSRLASIAGDSRDRPLSTSAFRRPGRPGALPSRRRRTRVRTALVGLTAGTVVAGLGVVGWAAAPVASLAGVPDPAVEARSAYGAAAAEVSLEGAALTALMLLDGVPSAGAVGAQVDPPPPGEGEALTSSEARQALRRSVSATGTVSLSGRQTLLVQAGGKLTTATVAVDTRSGQGSQLSLLEPGGERVATSFAPVRESTGAQQEALMALEQAAALGGRRGASVAGRAATSIEAFRQGRLVKRWWVDDETGVLLWQETYEASGAVSRSAGFRTLRLGVGTSILDHLPPRVPTVLTASETVGSSASAVPGWDCPDRIAGLALLRLSTDDPAAPGAVHAVYGDGVSTLGVLQQRGRLVGQPRDSTWDDTLGAWRHDGPIRWVTWQSGPRVVTVTTDGSAELVRTAVLSLPHAEPVSTTTLGRVHDGWSKILADSKG